MNVELAFQVEYGILRSLASSKYSWSSWAQRHPLRKTKLYSNWGKHFFSSITISTSKIIQLQLLQTKLKTLPAYSNFVRLTDLKLNFVYKGQMDRGQSDRGQTDRGQTDRGQTDRGQTDRGQKDRGQTDRGQTVEQTAVIRIRGPQFYSPLSWSLSEPVTPTVPKVSLGTT